MKILSIEIMGNTAGILILKGNKNNYNVTSLGKQFPLPKEDTSISDFLSFEQDFSNFIKKQNVDCVTLCEGGKDSKKMRVRMEFLVLTGCKKQNIEYKTYPTGSCTRLINTTYKKETQKEFSEELKAFKLPKYMSKALICGWRFLE